MVFNSKLGLHITAANCFFGERWFDKIQLANTENESGLKDEVDPPQVNLTRVLILSFRNSETQAFFRLPVFRCSPSKIRLG